MTEPSHAVFLSYASEDATAAERIATALRAAGIEVWFDKSQLRGGDPWDRQIRDQIHECRLFIPVISANSERRDEGYFRREWRLAVERAGDMHEKKAFLVPVVIDGTSERGAAVPEKFRELQWTRLPIGETPSAFVERVQRLLAPQDPHPGQSPHPAPSSAPSARASGARSYSHKGSRIVVLAIAAVAVIALGYVALERWVLSKHPAPVASSQSIAVLPLTNESGDPSQQYFSDGLAEDLITALSQIPGLKVIGRSSSFQFRDSKEGSKAIGEKLGVAHLVEGSVRRAGDVVRVSAELISASDGTTQWSERYDRPYKDLFALQDDITRAVAGALKVRLVQDEKIRAHSDRPPSGSLEAYNALLLGKFYVPHQTEADGRKAIAQFTAATQLDTHYALAWSWLAWTWAWFAGYWLDETAMQEAYQKASAAAETALALAPDLAFAHVARGYLLQYADFNWRGAEAEFHRALELEPNDSEARFQLGNLLAALGEVDKGVSLTREALATDPLRADWYSWLAIYLGGINHLDEAERAIRKAIDVQPGSESYLKQLTIIETQRGDAQAALSTAEQVAPGIWQDTALALARQIGGDHAAADRALKNLIEKGAHIGAYQIAQVYALRNDADKTFEWLDRAWSNRDPGITYLLYDPFILRYKDDPRFAAFCRKVGLPVPGKPPARKST